MKIDIYELKETNGDLSEFINETVYSYLLDLTEENIEEFKNTIKYNTIDSIGFIKEKNSQIYPDIKVIQQFDNDIYEKFITHLLIKFVYKDVDLMSSQENEWSIDDFENMSEEQVLEEDFSETVYSENDYLLYDSYYAKTLQESGFLEIKSKKSKLKFKKSDLNKSYYKKFLENSVSMISSQGLEYNKPVTNYLKEIKVLVP
jgi:hypothetical protein